MKDHPLYLGDAHLKPPAGRVSGDFVSLESERFYRIANSDQMEPFFMSVVSASNHWMFISSDGGLTAGRRNSDHALFPYSTEDTIHDSSDHTGSRTILRVAKDGRWSLWEPFSRHCRALYDVSRNLFKNVSGTKLMFEEINHDLGLVFRSTWTPSDTFGFVKHSEIENTSTDTATVEVLDGIENILPWGMGEGDRPRDLCPQLDSGRQRRARRSLASDGLLVHMASGLPTLAFLATARHLPPRRRGGTGAPGVRSAWSVLHS
jgi:hypothetical protein